MKSETTGWSSGDTFEASPDGKHSAEVRDAGEVAMGAPTSGKLYVNGRRVLGMRLQDAPQEDYGFSPSFVWSNDSRFLFLHAWNVDPKRGRRTRIALFDLEEHRLHVLEKPDSLGYELTDFSNGVLRNEHRSINLAKIMEPGMFGSDGPSQRTPTAKQFDTLPRVSDNLYMSVFGQDFRFYDGVPRWIIVFLAFAFAVVVILARIT